MTIYMSSCEDVMIFELELTLKKKYVKHYGMMVTWYKESEFLVV